MSRDTGSLRFTKGMTSRDRSDVKHQNWRLSSLSIDSFPAEVCEME